MNHAVELLSNLVAIPSLSGREEHACAFLADALPAAGWERVEIDGGDVVGYDEDENPAHIASQHSDVETYYATNPMHPGVRFDRVQITVGEPE